MRIEIPQELADTIKDRFSGVDVEQYILQTVRESIDASSPSAICWTASQSAVDKFYEED